MAKEQEVNIVRKLVNLVWLYEFYVQHIFAEDSNTLAIVSEARQLYGQLSAAHVTFVNYETFVILARWYQVMGMPNQANEILEGILTFFMQTYANQSIYAITFAIEFANFLETIGNFSGASKVAVYAVNASRSLKADYPSLMLLALPRAILASA